MGVSVQWPISWRLSIGESGQVRDNGATANRTQNEHGGGNANLNAGYGATANADNVQDVANLKGINLVSSGKTTSSIAGQMQARYVYSYWWTTNTMNYKGRTQGNGNSNRGCKTVIGQGITDTYDGMRGEGANNESPNDAIKGQGGGQTVKYKGGRTVVYKSYVWPEEGYSSTFYISESGIATGSQGGCQGPCLPQTWGPSQGQSTNSYTDGFSESARRIIAQGYYSGPPFYSTTTSQWGYVVVNKKLSSSTSRLNTVIIAPAISACKTQPENFVWLAGGLHGFEPIAYGVAEVLMREEFYAVQGGRVNFGEIGKSSWETIDNLSIISSSYKISDIATKQRLVKTVNGGVSITNVETPTVQATGYYMEYKTNQKNTTQISQNYDDDDDENPFPNITTVTTTFEQGSWAWTRPYTDGVAQDISVSGMGITTTSKYTDYFSTTAKLYPFGPDYFGGTTNGSVINSNRFGTTRRNYGTTRSYNKRQGVWTASKAVGYLSREYETSKIGYFYTNPDDRYFNAEGINTDFAHDTYRCYDAKCIDFLRFADAYVFQTATTMGNNQVSVNRKSPRDGRRWTKSINRLSEQDNFKQTHTEQAGINPHTGHAINTVSPYGNTATYSSQGVSDAKGIAQYSRVKVGLPRQNYPLFRDYGLQRPYNHKQNRL